MFFDRHQNETQATNQCFSLKTHLSMKVLPKNLKLDSKSQHKQNSILTMRKIEAESNLHSINSGLQFKQSM
jgi:hypothetical protein